MKKQYFKIIAKGFFVTAIFVAPLIASNHLLANNSKVTTVHTATSKLDVQYAGADKNGVLLNINFQNISGDNCRFVIVDENGEILFEEVFSKAAYSKTIQLPKPAESTKLIFSVKNLKTKTLTKSEVDVTPHITEDLLVNIK